MGYYIIPFGFAFLSVILIVPLLRKIAFKYQFVDIPNKRKVHKEPIPLLGGLAIFISYMLTMWLWVDSLKLRIALLLSGSFVVGLGLVDDYYKTRNKDLSAFPKILVQFAVGIILFTYGIRIQGITSFFNEGMVFFTPGLSLLITLLWIVGLMNIINFFDGLDGLASGISIISSMTLFLISYVKGLEATALLSIILMGSSLGFLKYNFFPAKIFMGDAGSVFLGLILAVISIEGALKSATLISILMVVLALGVPIFDTIVVLLKRWKQHKPLYLPDQNHAHHRLLRRGYTQKQAVAVLYVISIIFSLIAALVLFWLAL